MSEIIKLREKKALETIKSVYGTEDDEYGATLFVSHHLEEIEPSYWLRLTGESKPSPKKVLDLLVLKSHWDEDLAFDFTLPEEVTNYIICVRFEESNEIIEITMES